MNEPGQIFLAIFVAFFILELAVNLWLDTLNKKQLLQNPNIPPFFKNTIDPENYEKSRRYTLAKLQFNKWETLYSSLITLALLFSGLLPLINKWLSSKGWNPIFQGVLFLAALFILMSLLKYPVGLYHTFAVEGRFGFNRTTLSLYLKDTVKTVLLAAALGLPFLAALLWFLNYSGNLWWIWAASFIFGFQILMLLVYPTWIAPLFNKFKPLDDPEINRAVLDLAAKSGFSTSGVFIMDGSRRSGHSNAYFTGFGKLRRIVLFDTLIEQLNLNELLSVLCHEIGHYKRGHIYKTVIFSFLIQLSALFVLSLVVDWPVLYRTFGFEGDPQSLRHVGLFLFTVTFSTFTFLLAPLMNFRSRKHEFEADEYAVKHASPASMKTALIKLAEKNLSNLTPHAWYSSFHYSHPTVYERILAIQAKGG